MGNVLSRMGYVLLYTTYAVFLCDRLSGPTVGNLGAKGARNEFPTYWLSTIRIFCANCNVAAVHPSLAVRFYSMHSSGFKLQCNIPNCDVTVIMDHRQA